MTNLVSRIFQDKEVRFVGTADRPEWVAADIVTILYQVKAELRYEL